MTIYDHCHQTPLSSLHHINILSPSLNICTHKPYIYPRINDLIKLSTLFLNLDLNKYHYIIFGSKAETSLWTEFSDLFNYVSYYFYNNYYLIYVIFYMSTEMVKFCVYFSILFTLLFSFVVCKTFKPCDLAKILLDNEIDKNDVSTWLCIAR